ncbi:MAG: glycosyltransferase family 25 protein [Planctomycetota bacterium]
MTALFERAFVISLPHRADRLQDFRRQFAECSWLPEIEHIPAIDGRRCPPPENWKAGGGAWGCYRSHLNILETCLNENVASYCVFEDDAQLKRDFDVEKYIRTAHSQLPDDWGQFYLGGALMHVHSHKPTKQSSHLHRPFNVNRTHAFAVGRSGMASMYRHLCQLPFIPEEHIDHHLGRWHEQPKTPVYCLSHWMVGQHGSQSDISGRNEEIQFYKDAETFSSDHWLYSDPVVVLFRGSRKLLLECQSHLHAGNDVNSKGYDVGLHEATQMNYPAAAINRWYGHLRGEVVAETATRGTLRMPTAYHPTITEEMLREHVASKVIVIDHVQSRTDVLAQLHEQVAQYTSKRKAES